MPCSRLARLEPISWLDNWPSIQAPMRFSRWLRNASSAPRTRRAKPAITVSSNKVSVRPLDSTRSNTCIM